MKIYLLVSTISGKFAFYKNHSGSIKGAILALFIFLCIYCKKYIFAPD
jgi:hypothetical protein